MGLCQPYSDLYVNAYRSKPRASLGLSSENRGNLYQPKDGGSATDFGGSVRGGSPIFVTRTGIIERR
jgi:hypothetical protein